VQRKVIAPNDFHNLDEVENRLLDFQEYYQQIATPFEWKFTKADLEDLLDRIAAHENVQLHQPPNCHPQIRHRNSDPDHLVHYDDYLPAGFTGLHDAVSLMDLIEREDVRRAGIEAPVGHLLGDVL
jgi:hypothetical protein